MIDCTNYYAGAGIHQSGEVFISFMEFGRWKKNGLEVPPQ
jgi:hypothetical protein